MENTAFCNVFIFILIFFYSQIIQLLLGKAIYLRFINPFGKNVQ